MGFLSTLFGKDWQAELDRAEKLIARGEAVRALEIAARAQSRAVGPLASRAADLSQRARTAVVDSLLTKAAQAEAEEDWRDAADWLLAAIDHLRDDPRGEELESRRNALLDRDEEARNPYLQAREEGRQAAGESGDLSELEAHYETLISALDEVHAERYRDRPVAFQQAVVDLNDQRATQARQALEELLEGAPGDPVLQLELGHARLLDGDPAGARELLDQAWSALGDGPLDSIDSLSAPLLWAEAALASGLPTVAVLERLAELTPPLEERPALARFYADLLLQEERLDDALELLPQLLRRFPSDAAFHLLLARALAAGGEPEEAIARLEAVVGPACSGGRCAGPRLHLDSVRELSRLYLAQGTEEERVGELMAVVARNQGGLLTAADHQILALWYRQAGDDEASAHCAAEARRLAAAPEERLSAPPPPLRGGQRPAL